MADIILKNRHGEDVTYSGIETVTFNTPEEGVQATFTEGVAVEDVPVVLNLADGNQTMTAPDGTLVKSAVIQKPDTLIPENIRKGMTIAGVEGSLIGDTEELSVALNLAEGDQEVTPSADGKVISKVTIQKPETLLPENIREGTDVAGVTGTLPAYELLENLPVALDFSNGDMEFVAPDGFAVKSGIVQKPDTLLPENIAKDVVVAGITGTLKAGEVDLSGDFLPYVLYQIDAEENTLLVRKILWDDLYAATGSYDVNIPDKFGSFDVIIDSEGV